MNRAFAFLMFLIAAGFSAACAIVYQALPMSLRNETALVVWDEDAKVEHFIRGAEFDGSASDFGFVLPVPTQPFAIEVADPHLFRTLAESAPLSIGCSGSALPSKSGAQTLEEKSVGDYKVTVLRSADGAAMMTWLKANGYKRRPQMEPWLDHYAKQNWVFVAFKYQGQKGPTPTKAVRVSFKADRPHYPYKMPADTWELPHARDMNLFVLSQHEVLGRLLNGKEWIGSRWSTDVTTGPIGRLMSTSATPVTLPSNMTLTYFMNYTPESSFDSDLTFVPAPYRPPYLPLSVTAVVGVYILRRRRARQSQNSANSNQA